MANDQAQGLPAPPTPTLPPSKGEALQTGIGGFLKAATGQSMQGSDLEAAIQKHHDQRVEEARMNAESASRAWAILHDPNGIDPETGKPLDDAGRQRYQTRFDTAYAAYNKAAGVNKEAKGIIAQGRAVLDHFSKKVQQQRAQQPQGQGGGMPPPPQASASPGPTGGMLPGGIPPPPQASTTPPSSPQADEAIKGPFERQQMAEQADQRKLDRETASKIAIAKAAAAAKALNPSGAVRLASPLSMSEAKKQAAQGGTFLDASGEPIDLSGFDDTMQLVPVVQGHSVFYLPTNQRQTHLTVGNVTYAVPALEQTNIPKGAGTELGPSKTPTTTSTQDPTTGQTTTSKHVPATTGATGRGASATPPSAAAPSTSPTSKVASPKAASQGGAPTLDADGHIPSTGEVKATPQVIEGANQLLDGTDKDKLPVKTRELAAALARKYGWEQGRFTPKEQVMLKEASTFLDQAEKSPSLAVLDGGTISNAPLIAAARNTDKEGFITQLVQNNLAKQMTPQQQEFLRTYNQLVGTIAGLSQLVKGGRATEAQISRLRQELPNIITSPSSADARARIHRLQREIKIAMEKGQFSGSASGGVTKPLTKTPPPSATTSIDDEIQKAAAAASAPKAP